MKVGTPKHRGRSRGAKGAGNAAMRATIHLTRKLGVRDDEASRDTRSPLSKLLTVLVPSLLPPLAPPYL